jgi:predicted secreted hydrolase
MDMLKVEGHVSDDNGQPKLEIALTMHAFGPTFPYLASGVIPFPGGLNYEYAFPSMDTSGLLTVEGKSYNVKGESWFDREWGDVGPAKWTWITIRLNNGIRMAVWDQQKYDKASNSHVGGQAFCTILDTNGNITSTTAIIEECSSWSSPDSKQTYANSWKVTIPGKAELHVKTIKAGQEILSIIPRIEAKSTAEGRYDDKDVTGDAFAEVGEIPPF